MKRQLHGVLILSVVLVLVSAAQGGKREPLSIQVREAKLRNKPSFVGKPGAAVRYGSRVMVLERKNGWVKVQDGEGQSGWIHSSALTKKKIRLKSKTKKETSARSKEKSQLAENEIALAGKGLAASSDINSGELDYEWVDKMEKIVIAEQKIQTFLDTQQAKDEPKEEK